MTEGTTPRVGGGPVLLDGVAADSMAAAFVAHLRERGIARQSRVAFTATNSPSVLAAVYGCLRAGYAPVVLSPLLTLHERVDLLDAVRAALVVDEQDCQEMTQPGPTTDVELDHFFRCRPLHFTSGTSGRPKAVWSGWLDEAAARSLSGEETSIWGFDATDVHLVCAPLSHSAPLRFALHTLMAGGAVVVMPRFDVDVVASLIARGRVTTTFMAPTHLQRLLEQTPPTDSALRLLAHAGSACPEHVKREAIDRFGQDVVTEFYGSTEGQFTVCPSREWLERPGTVGRVRPGRELRVVDGQIWVRAPGYARFEYWGDSEKTDKAWDGDWFTVGDLGRLDEDEYLYLEGRRGDLIITGGVNVYPAEVERVLGGLPGVEKICVFGVPDEQWGSRVCAVVVGTVTETDLRAHASERLAGYKCPKTLLLVDELPLTHSGKIDRSFARRLLDPPTP